MHARTARRIGRFHLITDTVLQSRHDHAELARLAIAGGADTIQYRSKKDDIREMIAEASAMRDVCARAGVTFLVNDRVDLCLAVGADGVHLGRGDMPLEIARRILGPGPIIGGTVLAIGIAVATIFVLTRGTSCDVPLEYGCADIEIKPF